MNLREKIYIIKEVLLKMYPNKKTELKYKTKYQLLVAVLMSAQTTDTQVNKANKKFFVVLKKPEDALSLGINNIKTYIKSIGLFNIKAKNIYLTSKILIYNHNGEIPKSLEELMKLPGVGIKTAKVVASILYNTPYLAVDTHVHRVLNRLGIVNTKIPNETDKKAEKIFNKDDIIKLHYSLILFGRYNCKSRNPKCNKCPFIKICKFYKKYL